MIKIVRATGANLEQIAPLFDAYREFYRQESDLEGARSFLTMRFLKSDSIILLAFVDKVPVGFTQLYHTFSSVSMKPSYILNDLYVRKEYRGQGVAAELLEEAKTLAKANNQKGIALETEKNNPAQKLYERLDWAKDNELFHYYWTNKS